MPPPRHWYAPSGRYTCTWKPTGGAAGHWSLTCLVGACKRYGLIPAGAFHEHFSQ